MSKKNELVLNVNDIDVNTEITKDDLIAVAVARHEQKLLDRRKALEEHVKGLKDRMKKIMVARDKLINDVLHQRWDNAIKAFKDAMALFGEQAKCTTSWSWTPDCEWTNPNIPQVRGNLNVTIENRHSFLQKNFVFTLSGEALTKQGRINEIDELISRSMEELVGVRRDLANISRKERQARASFAVQLLKQTEKGSALLENIIAADNTPLLEI